MGEKGLITVQRQKVSLNALKCFVDKIATFGLGTAEETIRFMKLTTTSRWVS